MASQAQQPPPTDQPPSPPAPVPAAERELPTVQNLVVLVDWWVERLEGEGGGVRIVGITTNAPPEDFGGWIRKSNNTGSRFGRMFSSARIKKRNGNGIIDTVDDLKILIRGPLNIPRMDQNGFPHEVSKYFPYGFPPQWEKYINANMKEMNKEAPDPSDSTEYDIATANTCDMPEKTIADTRETCYSGQVENQHESMHIGACEQRTTVQHGAENIAQHGASSAGPCVLNQQEYNTIHMPADLEDCRTPKGCKTVHLGAADALQVPMEGTSPHFGVVQGSENAFRRLRSGKVYEMSNGLSLKKRAFKRDIMQDKTLNMKMGPCEGVIRPADLISHENVGSVPGVVTADKLQLHDSRHQEEEEEAGKRRRKRRRCGQLGHDQKIYKKPVNDPLAPTPASLPKRKRNRKIERAEVIYAPKLLSIPSKATTSKATQSRPVTRSIVKGGSKK